MIIIVCLSAALVDQVEAFLARPLRPRMILKMFRLARGADRGICESYYLARTFERATRPKVEL